MTEDAISLTTAALSTSEVLCEGADPLAGRIDIFLGATRAVIGG